MKIRIIVLTHASTRCFSSCSFLVTSFELFWVNARRVTPSASSSVRLQWKRLVASTSIRLSQSRKNEPRPDNHSSRCPPRAFLCEIRAYSSRLA